MLDSFLRHSFYTDKEDRVGRNHFWEGTHTR